MQVYQLSPGPSAAAVRQWPDRVPFVLDAQRPTLVLAAHPDCPCTQASLEELTRLLSRAGAARVATHIVIYSDPAFDERWRKASGWTLAAEVPGATLHADPRGQTARALGVQTSGHALLFAPDGHRLFSGGITPARGERGDSAGAEAIVRFVQSGGDRSAAEPAVTATAPVFGCLLWGDEGARTS